jgi:sporulation protein YlmC with PRC-barrel domain
MDGTSQEITTLVGREVYSNNGVFVGEVEDVRLNLDQETVTGLAVGQLNAELFAETVPPGDPAERPRRTAELNAELFAETVPPGKGVVIPYRWVRAVGDVILINDVIERLKQPEEAEEAVV